MAIVHKKTIPYDTVANAIPTTGGGGGGGGTSSTFGVAVPGTGTAAGFKDPGGLMQLANLDAAGLLKVNVAAGSGGNGAAGSTGVAVPAQADYQGIDVAGTLRGAKGFDLDSGVGTEFVQGVSLRKTASGGSSEFGTLADPLRTDPTGATTQPISAASLPLPTGASTETTLGAVNTNAGAVADVAITSDVNGTISAKLRGLVKILADVWDSVNHWLKVSITNATLAVTQSGTWTVQPGNTPNTTPWLVTQIPAASGGLSLSRTLSAATTNATSVKASAGQLYGFILTNTNAAVRYVKLYNKASAPTVGTDTPVMTLAVPGNAAGAGMIAAEFTSGIAFGTGIAFAITTGVTDADVGAVAANEIIVHLMYK